MVKKKVLSKEGEEKTGFLGIPEGVLIIAVLMFASSFFSFLLALSMFNVANPVNYQLLSLQTEYQGGVTMDASMFIYMGLMFVLAGLISYFIARGLVKLQKRAWIAFMILLVVSFISSIYVFISASQYYTSIYLIIIQLIVAIYMMQKKVVVKFKN